MSRTVSTAAAVALVLVGLLAAPSPVAGHGGRYRGPLGEVPPPPRDPNAPQPPGSWGPAPSRPEPAPQPPPGKPAPPPPFTREGMSRALDFGNWIFWWYGNDDALLAERFPVRALTDAESKTVAETIVPALVKTLGVAGLHPDVRAGAVLALARTGGVGDDFFLGLASAGGEEQIVRESAILALGLGRPTKPEIRDALIGIADEKERPWRERCFALIALGLLRDTTDETRACFLRRLDGTERVDDLPLSALFAIGLTGDTTWGPELANWLATGKAGKFDLSERGRAVALGALGRIGDPAAIPSLWTALADESSEVQVAAALALGRGVPAADAETRRRFLEWFPDGDRPASGAARNALLLSAARVAAAPEATEAERVLVRRAIVAPSEGADRDRPGYAALALGLLGAREGEDSSVADLLRLRLRLGTPDPEPSPAGRRPWPPHTPGLVPEADAVALGLLRDDRKETVDLLLSVFANRGLPRKLRAMAATALGLIGDPRAAGPVTASLTNREDRDLRVDVATAAGLLPTEGTRDGLLAAFSDPRSSQFVLGSAAMALGRFRAFDAVPRLLEILQPDRANGDYPDLVRALAVCALGRIGSRATGCGGEILEAMELRLVSHRDVLDEALYLVDRDVEGHRIEVPIDLDTLAPRLESRDLNGEGRRAFVAAAEYLTDRDAKAVALAIQAAVPLVTDDRRIRRIVSIHFPELPLVSTLELLKDAAERMKMDARGTVELLRRVRDRGSFAPPRDDPLSNWYSAALSEERPSSPG